ncbi:MAG: 1-acyl-sn-glycerol-3-phosphate acyltransferase [Campylobacteraceae bacterium]|jgi:1-acyl-sn-glycerol-3-phosphate acyltransferase|nr:1-acyl-sn-glycerol-3-phosphate acyltransferase [Campylobacteraceae bacterium]MBT3882142.1 1-acyl-sn-glycerol-3-phosphate acyltransferase [Campylobacteraceae bacterium]MBT4031150.1 1-acyl-sn-glycerol-3-phosphate acyltransferase [Campylobacteraceae bacterium]MBT4178849.1 1-acyl-sn-glycerol-3-phosphate acyltransferase [Campylobacteraceae bacterium]MBT4572078.1 1-acyl-sn-glycerol-3-phosphate acyltransferase [Campylobacteraceae bacterium]
MIIFQYLRFLFTILQLLITVTIVIILMFLFNKHNRKIRIAWGKLQLFLLGIKLDIVGSIDEDADLLMINHQSMLDIIIFEAILKKDIAWIAKKEISKVPFFGLVLKLPKMIIVDRENKAGLAKLLKETKVKKFEEKRPVAIFPEGTRGKGKRLLKFKSGAKLIAQKHNMKVQPIILMKTRELLDSQGFKAKSGTVKVIYLPAVEASKGTNWFEDTEMLMNETFNHNKV